MENAETKICPLCGEEIKEKAVKCRYCQSDLIAESVGDSESKKVTGNSNIPYEKSESASTETHLFCRNCGTKVNKKAEVCISCGVRPLNGNEFCQECGAETSGKQEICIKCGCRLKSLSKGGNLNIDAQEMVYPSNPPKNPWLAAFLSLCIVGVGQIYLGQTLKGIAWFIGGVILAVISSGILGPVILIAAIIDAYRIGKKLAEGSPVGKWELF